MDNVALRTLIMSLETERDELYEKLDPINKSITQLRKLCTHNWKNIGRDSHKDHYECTICGERDEW